MPAVAVSSGQREIFHVPSGNFVGGKFFKFLFFGNENLDPTIAVWDFVEVQVNQSLKERAGIGLGGVDYSPSGTVPAAPLKVGAYSVEQRMPSIGQTESPQRPSRAGGHSKYGRGVLPPVVPPTL